MATTKPRIQVTVSTSQYSLLQRLSKLQKRPMSAVLSELFDEIEPVYERVAVVMEAAIRAQQSAKQGMVDALQSAEAEIAPHVAAAMGQFDLLERHFGVTAASGVPSGARVPLPAATPALVTRGSETPTTPTRTRPSSAPDARNSHLSRKQRRHKGRLVRSLADQIVRQVKKGPKGSRP